jgi:epoxide hydrolase
MTQPGIILRPFSLHVEGVVLDDLRRRLAGTRWPDEPPGAAWSTGSSLAYMHTCRRWWRIGATASTGASTRPR